MVVMSIKISDGNVIRSRNENGNSSMNVAPVRPVKWKRRNVCAVREYPPGCGPVPLEAEPVLLPVVNDRVDGGEPVGSVVGNLGNNEGKNGDVKVDNGGSVVKENLVTNEVQNGDVKVDNGGSVVKENLVDDEVQNGDVNMNNGGSAVKENLVNEEGRYVDVMLDNIGGSVVKENLANMEGRYGDVNMDNYGVSVVKEGRPMKFKPRKVCAVRDFPPFCGPNAGEPTEEERRRINGRGGGGIESNRNVKGDLGQKIQSKELNEASIANEEMKMIDESKTDVDDRKIVKGESSKKVQNIGQACKELVVHARDKDMKSVSPVDDAHDVDSEDDDRDNTPLSIIKKGMDIKNQEVGSKKQVKKRPPNDTKDPVFVGGKIKVVMGLKAPSVCEPVIQQKEKAKGHASITLKNNKEKVVGESSSIGTFEKVEKDLTNKGKGDASTTPKQSVKKKQKKDTVTGTLAMVVGNEEVSVADIEEKDLTNKGDGDASVTPKNSRKKKQKQVPVPSPLAMVVSGEEDFVADFEENEEGTHDVDVSLPPFGPRSSDDARNKVRQTLRLFQALCRKILQGEEARTEGVKLSKRRVDLNAKAIMAKRGRIPVLGEKTYGPVPGVEVGDEFQYRVELFLVGIHRPFQAGIDFVKKGNEFFAVSVVASGGYKNEVDKPDCLIYSGAGGVAKDKSLENQKLERGNLALKNNVDLKYPVRVIRGYKVKSDDSSDSKSKMSTTYIYDGLYTVESWKQEPGPKGNMVFQFELRRIPGQPQLAKREVMSKKFKIREGVCVKDISNGKEKFPICAINTIDDQKPPEFTYITKIMYPDWYKPTPPKGCDCVGRCSEKKCACAFRNGGEFPYNRNGAIVEAKPLVYECGPSCRCPPGCYNRVAQHGMKIHLEIFKTETRGWGVRSLSSIASGSFICEYVGELLEDKEAEERKSNDEYLFDIGQNYNDCAVNPDAQSEKIVDSGGGFTIDAAHYGNVGRFINHSCSPNLYAQNVLYDQDDKRMPHIMLFAAENISPLQELTYHYNYAVDEVTDADGNIKVKNCYCGSSECTGRLY